MARARKAAARDAASDSDSEDDYTWKPDWQVKEEKRSKQNSNGAEHNTDKEKAKTKSPTKPAPKAAAAASKGGRRSASPSASSDDEAASSPPASPNGKDKESFDDEKESEDIDNDADEWRYSMNHPTERQSNNSQYQQQLDKWNKFRAEFPIPFKQSLSAGAILALRKQLKHRKKLVFLGIPVPLRRDMWELLSGARAFPEKLEHNNRYQFYLKHPPSALIMKQINSDAPRALKGHLKFSNKGAGQTELIRVLQAFAVRAPSVGYANGMCHVAAFFLLFYQEERAFWMLCTLVDIILPPDYYSNSLLGVRADAQLIKILVFQRLPRLHAHLVKFNLDVYVIALRWLLPLFLVTLPLPVCIRMFDIVMLEGSNFLLSICLALFHLFTKKICALTEEMALIEYMDKLGSDEKSINVEELLNMALSSKCLIAEEELKRREVERRIMESAYMKDLQVTQKFRRAEQERKKKEAAERKKELEAEIQALSYGTTMWKIGKQGKPRQTKIYVRNESPKVDDMEKRIYTITWESKSKEPAEARLLLRDCSLYVGLQHGQFVKRPDVMKQFVSQQKQAFSVVSPVRSLDLVCLTAFDFEEWMKVFKRIPMREKEMGDSNKKKKTTTEAAGSSSGGGSADGVEEEEDIKEEKKPNSGAERKTLAEIRAARQAAAAKAQGSSKATTAKTQTEHSDDDNSDDDHSPPVTKRKR